MSGLFTVKEVPAIELRHGDHFQDEYKTLYRTTGKKGNEIHSVRTSDKSGELVKWDVRDEVFRLDFLDLDPAKEIAKQMGGVDPVYTEDPIVVLLYLLMRDHLGTGVIEKFVNEMATNMPGVLTNRYLACYADNIAERLRIEADNDVVAMMEASRA